LSSEDPQLVSRQLCCCD